MYPSYLELLKLCTTNGLFSRPIVSTWEIFRSTQPYRGLYSTIKDPTPEHTDEISQNEKRPRGKSRLITIGRVVNKACYQRNTFTDSIRPIGHRWLGLRLDSESPGPAMPRSTALHSTGNRANCISHPPHNNVYEESKVLVVFSSTGSKIITQVTLPNCSDFTALSWRFKYIYIKR